MLNVHKLFHGSKIYGPGVRDVIWFKGCTLHCKECINQELWSKSPESLYTPEELASAITSSEVTLLGGEPLQQEEILDFIKRLKKRGIGIVLFTGYELNELHGSQLDAARLCDCVISGRFDPKKKDDSLYLIGSSNQRIDLFSDRYAKDDFKKTTSYEIVFGDDIELHGRNKSFIGYLLGTD